MESIRQTRFNRPAYLDNRVGLHKLQCPETCKSLGGNHHGCLQVSNCVKTVPIVVVCSWNVINQSVSETVTIFLYSFSHPGVEGLLFWGFWEKQHWKGADAALVNGDSMTVCSSEVYVRSHASR